MLEIVKVAVLGVSALVALFLMVRSEGHGVMLCSVVGLIGIIFFLETKKKATLLPVRGKAVVITGCDTGFGHCLAIHLAELGMTVFAGCLNVEGPGAAKLREEGGERVHVVQMDVTSDEQIAAAVTYVNENLGHNVLWGVVNNAGLNFMGELELCTMEMYKRVADINIFGMVRVTKAFLPHLRRSKGRVLNVTSVKGQISSPLNACYNITKFAGETFSDILRMEMKKWGVAVAIIEPGHFGLATSCGNVERHSKDYAQMWDSMNEELRSDYGKEFMDHHVTVTENAMSNSASSPQPVIDAMTLALLEEKPKCTYIIPGTNGYYDVWKWLIVIKPYLPTTVMDRLTMWVFDAGFPTPTGLQGSRA